jgi:hypothetical protein
MRILLYGAALSLTFGLAAQAQTPPGAAAPGTVNPPAASPAAPAPSAAAPPAADANATTSPYKAGMAIKDAQGSTIGTIARVIRTPDGATTISANVDGRNVNLPASTLTLSADGGAVSSMSKAQITASTAPPS